MTDRELPPPLPDDLLALVRRARQVQAAPRASRARVLAKVNAVVAGAAGDGGGGGNAGGGGGQPEPRTPAKTGVGDAGGASLLARVVTRSLPYLLGAVVGAPSSSERPHDRWWRPGSCTWIVPPFPPPLSPPPSSPALPTSSTSSRPPGIRSRPNRPSRRRPFRRLRPHTTRLPQSAGFSTAPVWRSSAKTVPVPLPPSRSTSDATRKALLVQEREAMAIRALLLLKRARGCARAGRTVFAPKLPRQRPPPDDLKRRWGSPVTPCSAETPLRLADMPGAAPCRPSRLRLLRNDARRWKPRCAGADAGSCLVEAAALRPGPFRKCHFEPRSEHSVRRHLAALLDLRRPLPFRRDRPRIRACLRAGRRWDRRWTVVRPRRGPHGSRPRRGLRVRVHLRRERLAPRIAAALRPRGVRRRQRGPVRVLGLPTRAPVLPGRRARSHHARRFLIVR